MRTLYWFAFFAGLSVFVGQVSTTTAQDFQLVEPTGVISADVYMRPGQMVINDGDGAQFVFHRDPSFDSLNQKYAGYILPSVNRIVRFPRSGGGLMQIADLDDFRPHYVFSRRSVRRVGRHPGYRHPRRFAYIPPYFLSPYAFPRYGYGYFSFGTSLTVIPPIGPFPYGGPHHYWRPVVRPSLQSVVLDSRIVVRDPLPPVSLDLLNSASREMIVTVNDRVKPDQAKRLRLAPGRSQSIVVERDAGADRIRRVRTFAPDGSQITREIVTPIPPLPRYELVVHEWRLQSVAIDRTGKSPNVIEDSQFQGRGLGRFVLPPGDQVTGGTLDVVRAALSAGNQGTVAPILDDQGGADSLRPVSPLEQMLLQQRKAQRR